MDEPGIIIEGDEIILPEDPDAQIAALDKFIAGIEANRDKLAMISDEDLEGLKQSRHAYVRACEASRLADKAAEKARNNEARSRAAYEKELQAHQTRQIQAGLSKSAGAKRKFQD